MRDCVRDSWIFWNRGIEDGVVENLQGSPLLAVEIEDDDFVAARFEERRGQVERFLRTDIPEAAERAAVDPDHAFAQLAGVEEGVGRVVDGESGVIEARTLAGRTPLEGS